jgi:hypothetical protein
MDVRRNSRKTIGESMMRSRFGFLFSLVILTLVCSTGVAAAAPADISAARAGSSDAQLSSSGLIGPGNSLYGLKITLENLDESFTFDQNERLEKQVSHAELRLSELMQELAENRTGNAEIALEEYRTKLNQTELFLEPFLHNETTSVPEINNTGLVQAQEMIAKHQQILGDLLQNHPNNTGLAYAYNNSIQLEEKFTMKIESRNQNRQSADNSTPAEQVPGQGPYGNMTRPVDQNQTFQPDRGMGQDNMTVPMDWNQTRDMNRFSGNSTRNMDQNLLGDNQSFQDPNWQQGQNTTGNTKNQNDNNNPGNNQNTDFSLAPDTNGNPGNNRNQDNNGNTNTMIPSGGSKGQDITTRQNSANGGNSNGNTNGNLPARGR